MNEEVRSLVTKGYCQTRLYCHFIEDIEKYLDFCTNLAVVYIPDDEDVYVDDDKFYTCRLVIKRIMPFCKAKTWKYLYENGVDVVAVLMKEYGHAEIVKYLKGSRK